MTFDPRERVTIPYAVSADFSAQAMIAATPSLPAAPVTCRVVDRLHFSDVAGGFINP